MAIEGEKPQAEQTTKIEIEYNNFGSKLLGTIFNFKKEVQCVVWAIPNGVETAIGSKKVKLGSQQFELNKRLYNIDYSAIQHRFGKLIYNCHFESAVSPLRFSQPNKTVDAKNARELLQRNTITALWGSWKMPLIVALVAMFVAIALVVAVAVIVPQWVRAEDRADSLQEQLDALAGLPQPIPQTNTRVG